MHIERKLKNPKEIEIEISRLNEFALSRVEEYQKLKISNFEISTPFFSNDIVSLFGLIMRKAGLNSQEIKRVFSFYNNNRIPFGWFRGKGTPKQITTATEEIANYYDLDLSQAKKPEVIIEFMKSVGLGIDCSGFVYQTLHHAFRKIERPEMFMNSLSWENNIQEKNEYNVGVQNFLGKASQPIFHREIQPLDIIVTKHSKDAHFSHIATILRRESGLVIAHSAIGQIPTGVNVSPLRISQEGPEFGFKPNLTASWENLYKRGMLEFRRLNIVSSLVAVEKNRLHS